MPPKDNQEPEFNMLLNFDVKNDNSGKNGSGRLARFDTIGHRGMTFDQALISAGGFGTYFL
jgi:hypothetical protein